MKERRDELKKITEILIRCRTQIKPTRLMSDARLTYYLLSKLVDKLLKRQLLELIPPKDGDRVSIGFYRTTFKGDMFLKNALRCYELIDDEYIKKLMRKVKVF